MIERPLRILLIDDDEDAFVLTKSLLKYSGEPCELNWASSYEDGLAQILHGTHDAYLIDYQLGPCDGLELLKEAVARGCRAPLILCTGQDDRSVDLEAMRLGAADCLVKGEIDAAGLERSVRYALQWTRREQAEHSLRESEASYYALVNNLPVCVLRKDLEGRFVFANQAFCDFNDRKLSDVLGKTDFDFSPADVAKTFRADDRKVVETGKQQRRVEVNVNNEHSTWVEVIKTPVHNAQGQIVGTQAIFWDVSEQQRAIAAVRSANEAAQAANRAKSEFLANMSHEIRTPMNAVIGMTELVLGTELTATQREYLTLVLQAGESLLTIINEILDFSKIEAGKFDLEATDFAIWDELGDLMKSLALRAHGKDLELAYQIVPEVPETLVGDPVRLRQVLLNLVGNAIKFTENGEVVLKVTREAEDDQRIQLRFAVSDTGIGIPVDKQGQIFEAFTQADNTTTRRFGGTGLGLAISSRIVALMGDQIRLASTAGDGSTFSFSIWLGKSQKPPRQRVQLPSAIMRGTEVLIVDDNATNRKILEEMVSSWKLIPVCVSSAVDALNTLRERSHAGKPVSLLLTDMHMPEMDGLALVQAVRADRAFANLSIIALTSGDRDLEVKRLEGLAVASHFLKPVKQSDLLRAIDHALRSQGTTVVPTSEVPTPAVPKIDPLRILLAEDGQTNQKLAIALLEKWGHQVTLAENGLEAVQHYQYQRFDLILMDIQMPLMDGLEATHSIRELEEKSQIHTPIVAMTARALKGDRERCLEAGMDGYVSKPIRQRDLYDAIAPFFPQSSRTALEMLRLNPVDFSKIGLDPEILDVVMEAFLEEAPELLHRLEQALQAEDATAVQRTAHSLKGCLLPFAVPQLVSLAQTLEQRGKAHDLQDATASLSQLQFGLQELRGMMDAFRKIKSNLDVSSKSPI